MTENIIAVYPLSNWGGVEIMEIENGINDLVVWRYNFGSAGKAHKTKVDYTTAGRAFFRTKHFRVYLDQCMRV